MRVSTPPSGLCTYTDEAQSETENRLLAIAAESSGYLEVYMANPGAITAFSFGTRSIMVIAFRWTTGMP